jgi:ABC-2 type transport system permease protein
MTVTPIFTMRLVAEEANRGTLEMLLTSPIREWEIVVGKFFGALTAYAAIFAVTLLYPAILLRFSDPDIGPMIAQYLGIFLLCGAFIGVGLFASSVTDSQVLAAVFGYILLFGFWIVSWVAEALPGSAGDIGKAVSLLSHLEKFNRGIIDSVDVFYYVAFTSIFLLLSLRFVEARRWAA